MVKKSGWHSVGLGTQSGRHSVGAALSRDGTQSDGTQSGWHSGGRHSVAPPMWKARDYCLEEATFSYQGLFVG